MAIHLVYAGKPYEITAEGERELRSIAEGGAGCWFDLVRDGESVSLWIDRSIPMSIVTGPDVDNRMISFG